MLLSSSVVVHHNCFSVLNQLFYLPDAVFLILSGVGSFFRALIFLTAKDVNTLNAVFILGKETFRGRSSAALSEKFEVAQINLSLLVMAHLFLEIWAQTAS